MDIIIESVNTHGHIFRTHLRRQVTPLKAMRVRGTLEQLAHRNIRTMDSDGCSLPLLAA